MTFSSRIPTSVSTKTNQTAGADVKIPSSVTGISREIHTHMYFYRQVGSVPVYNYQGISMDLICQIDIVCSTRPELPILS